MKFHHVEDIKVRAVHERALENIETAEMLDSYGRFLWHIVNDGMPNLEALRAEVINANPPRE